MPVLCPACRAEIEARNPNVAADMVFCPRCGTEIRPGLVVGLPARSFVFGVPPHGAWVSDTQGEILVGAKANRGTALAVVPIACVWTGIWAAFVAERTIQRTFGSDAILEGIGLLVAIVLWGVASVTMAGRVEVRVSGEHGSIFAGVGHLGWTRRFEACRVRHIGLRASRVQLAGQPLHAICMVTDSGVLHFGRLLCDARRQFLVAALSSVLLNSGPTR